MPKRSNEKGGTPFLYQILLVGLIIGMLLFALKQFVIDDMQSQITRLDRQIKELQERIDKAAAFEQRKAEYEEKYRVQLRELEIKKAILPKEKETDELVRRLERLAMESRGISINTFRPRVTINRDFYYEWPITISCQAGYHALGQFFEQIAALERIFNISELKLETLNSGSDNRPTIKASFLASTFVYTGDDTEKLN